MRTYVLIVSQNFIAVGLAKLLGVDTLVGLCTGSIPMVGGHGTAGAFGPVLEVIEPSTFVALMRKRIAVQKQRFCQ